MPEPSPSCPGNMTGFCMSAFRRAQSVNVDETTKKEASVELIASSVGRERNLLLRNGGLGMKAFREFVVAFCLLQIVLSLVGFGQPGMGLAQRRVDFQGLERGNLGVVEFSELRSGHSV